MGLIKSIVIGIFPQWLIGWLRLYRPVYECVCFILYSLHIAIPRFFPFYLKYKSKMKSGVSVGDSPDERVRWGEAFCLYNSKNDSESIPLMWADGPIPGNYGDWLAPYIVSRLCNVNVVHVNEVGIRRKPHLIALGSILSLSTENSVVIGAGIASRNEVLDTNSNIISVRGPYSAERLAELGGGRCSKFGDIGFLLKRVYKPNFSTQRDKIVVVRHIKHRNLDLNLDARFREVSIFRSRPDDIEDFIDELTGARLVVTSAMHCFITCISYSIPCVLFSMGDWKNSVPGDGVKYLDALAGVGLPEVLPVHISPEDDFCTKILLVPPYLGRVSENVLDDLEVNLKQAVSIVLDKNKK